MIIHDTAWMELITSKLREISQTLKSINCTVPLVQNYMWSNVQYMVTENRSVVSWSWLEEGGWLIWDTRNFMSWWKDSILIVTVVILCAHLYNMLKMSIFVVRRLNHLTFNVLFQYWDFYDKSFINQSITAHSILAEKNALFYYKQIHICLCRKQSSETNDSFVS